MNKIMTPEIMNQLHVQINRDKLWLLKKETVTFKAFISSKEFTDHKRKWKITTLKVQLIEYNCNKLTVRLYLR